VTALRCGLDSSNWRPGEQSREACKTLLGTEVTEEQVPPFDAVAAHVLYRDLFGGIEDLTQGKAVAHRAFGHADPTAVRGARHRQAR